MLNTKVNVAALAQQVTSFTLVNADTDKDIQTIASGATLNLATLPTKNLSIRVNTNPAIVGSVKLVLSGTLAKSVTENGAPYALFGDNTGDYNGWVPEVGSYTLKATPYTLRAGGGTAGTAQTISFTVVNQSTTVSQQVTSLTLYNADTKKSIQTLTNGSTLDLNALPTRNLNIRATTNPSIVGSVTFTLSGTESKSATESLAPYDMMGDAGAWTPAPGSYTLKVTPFSAAKGTGTAGTTLSISFTVVDQQEILVNFQDPATVPPAGWVRDYGQPFGLRTGSYQGRNLTYGWKKRSDGSLLNLSVGGTTPGNGRDRGMPTDVLLATLMHMQADVITGTFNGTKAEGYWEAKVPNGLYDVTVTAGDAGIYPFPESHSINVEGVKAISNFNPSGSAGALTRFKTATVRVNVADGLLTINADGGTNTKINSAKIIPVTDGPFTYWSANSQDLAFEEGSTSTVNTFSLDLSNSLSRTDVQYTLSAVYSSGGTGWLSFDATHTGTEPNVTFNYAAARNLPAGTYTATVSAAAPGYTSGKTTVKVTVAAPRPYVISSTPANGAINISINTSSIAANSLYVPEVAGYKGGVDNSTITSATVKLLKLGTITTEVLGVVQGTGGGDAISFSPTFALEANTTYKFVVTDGVKSFSGAAFKPYAATFTTGDIIATAEPLAVEFTKVSIPGTQNKKYSSLSIGPDGKLYALRLDGVLERFTINHTDGTLSEQQFINTVVSKYGNRSAVGLVFDPASTATNLIAYVSHCSSGLQSAPEFDGNISRLSGANLEKEQLLVTKLPRSAKDHLVNSMAFGPDGALYFCQGSNSSMGAYDGSWQRNESLLSGAVLRLDMKKLGTVTLPLNVLTTADQQIINSASGSSMLMADGTYNPYSSSSPLTIYASGVRNAYDLVWHSNGQLYVPANGSAAGGNTPASVAGTRRPNGTFYNGPAVVATSSVQVQNDWLFRINPLKPVGYYGHPNPTRGEFVVNHGYADNAKYPSTLGPDQNYRGDAYNFETNKSPNGALEYKSNAFNGALKGKLLVCRFSGGGDIIVLEPGSIVKDPAVTSASSNDEVYNIVQAQTGAGTSGLVGMSGFINPLDIVEDQQTGNLYVIEFNWNNNATREAQITLLRVSELSDVEGFASAYPAMISATEVVGATETETTYHAVTIANTGRGTLNVKGIDIEGADAGDFKMIGAPDAKPNKKIKIRKNSSITFNVAFTPSSKGRKKAKLKVVSQKKKKDQQIEVQLDGLGIVYEEAVEAAASDSAAITASAKNALTTKATEETIQNNSRLKVYPNPNVQGSKVYIELEHFGEKEPVTITMYDALGQVVQAKTITTDAHGIANTEMPITEQMSAGIYIIKAQAASGEEQAKLVIE
ncbi:T9SS type A sorting domain-containing protein [Pontibacter sp. 172403-2]|uniref:T9SS type A sorting domain-containing protein n=1 Tax=Pontibacter rufus TaxID=2791028 RepID=UPI0018AFA3BE|nr:T9SS type A sorting domain-containing protein [Pontibacter sp. 172403-2]MBF9252721.1 T9SS type A sorting domain-containing protein [Pontibacter sp. 172403-2]